MNDGQNLPDSTGDHGSSVVSVNPGHNQPQAVPQIQPHIPQAPREIDPVSGAINTLSGELSNLHVEIDALASSLELVLAPVPPEPPQAQQLGGIDPGPQGTCVIHTRIMEQTETVQHQLLRLQTIRDRIRV